MIDEGMVLLQNCMDLEKDILGPYSETCLTSHDGSQVSSVKAEWVFDIKEEEQEIPVPVTFQAINTECEEGCMAVCPLLSRLHKYPELCIVFLISSCLFIHPST
jgi:hypothetical protein